MNEVHYILTGDSLAKTKCVCALRRMRCTSRRSTIKLGVYAWRPDRAPARYAVGPRWLDKDDLGGIQLNEVSLSFIYSL